MKRNKTKIDHQIILRILPECDGRRIFEPDWLIAQGLPKTLIDRVTVTYEYDPKVPKSAIIHYSQEHPNGVLLTQLRGVASLDLLWELAKVINAKINWSSSAFLGRGSGARELVKTIKEAIAKMEKEET